MKAWTRRSFLTLDGLTLPHKRTPRPEPWIHSWHRLSFSPSLSRHYALCALFCFHPTNWLLSIGCRATFWLSPFYSPSISRFQMPSNTPPLPRKHHSRLIPHHRHLRNPGPLGCHQTPFLEIQKLPMGSFTISDVPNKLYPIHLSPRGSSRWRRQCRNTIRK